MLPFENDHQRVFLLLTSFFLFLIFVAQNRGLNPSEKHLPKTEEYKRRLRAYQQKRAEEEE